MSKLSRDEKEQLYITKTIELQRLWQNPVPRREEFDFSDATEEWLDRELEKTNSLIRYEKRNELAVKALCAIFYVVAVAIGVGLLGLLLFGIRQITSLFL